MKVAPRPVTGTVGVPGDKSISHRAAILAAIAHGESVIHGYSPAGDCVSTLSVLEGLGVKLIRRAGDVRIHGRGVDGLRVPLSALDCGRSGTAMRLLAGVLATAPFPTRLIGDRQLLRRPMARVAEPLRLMGALVGLGPEGRPPIALAGGAALRGIEYLLPVASAQVKSAVLLAGLRAEGTTEVIEPVPTRDHTERMLVHAGASVVREPGRVGVDPGELHRFELEVPGDFSSAAPILVAAAMVPGSEVHVEGVGLNPTRTGFLEVLRRMGVLVEVTRTMKDAPGAEPRGDVRVRHQPMSAVGVEREEIPSLIDELPLVGVMATQAEGTTVVRGAEELRVKESDRIGGLVAGLRALGASAEETGDGFAVTGPTPLFGGTVDAGRDHRLAMAFAVAGLVATREVLIEGMGYVADSFPGFERLLEGLR